MDGEEEHQCAKLRTPRQPRMFAPDRVEEETAYACYATGFGRAHGGTTDSPLWKRPPTVVEEEGVVELLLIARVPMSEGMWRTQADAWITSVQMHELVSGPVHGAACVERFIEKTKKKGGQGPAEEALWDAYRLLSDGRMHPDDERGWCMSLRAMRAMRADMLALESSVRKLLRERMEVVRLIEYGESVLDTAQMLCVLLTTAGDSPALAMMIPQQGRDWLMEQQRMELRALEGREFELVHAIHHDSEALAGLARVRARQEPLRAQRRAETARTRTPQVVLPL